MEIVQELFLCHYIGFFVLFSRVRSRDLLGGCDLMNIGFLKFYRGPEFWLCSYRSLHTGSASWGRASVVVSREEVLNPSSLKS